MIVLPPFIYLFIFIAYRWCVVCSAATVTVLDTASKPHHQTPGRTAP